MLQLFHTTSENCSRIVTEQYSTSFASAIRLLHKDLRNPIFSIYGFVRLADEIVDSFHEHDKELLLNRFRSETDDAIDRRLSLNPILNSFQLVVNSYKIDRELIAAFFQSMEQDLLKKTHDKESYQEYIYGSAEVVGLICLYVFCEGNRDIYKKLEPSARALGAAFQKVNFLRDIQTDFNGLSRVYFPGCDFSNLSSFNKKEIEEDIEHDFHRAYQGILELPMKARFGVYVAYKYYRSLFKKIKGLEPARVFGERIRISNYYKALILFRAGVKNQFRLI